MNDQGLSEAQNHLLLLQEREPNTDWFMKHSNHSQECQTALRCLYSKYSKIISCFPDLQSSVTVLSIGQKHKAKGNFNSGFTVIENLSYRDSLVGKVPATNA